MTEHAALYTASFLAAAHRYLALDAPPLPGGQAPSTASASQGNSQGKNQGRNAMNHDRQFAQSILLATGLSAFVAGPAFADHDCGAMTGGHDAHYAQREKMKEQHHQQLHDALKLSAEQEAGWKKLIDSERMQPAAMDKKEDWSTLTTPERAEKMLAHGKARQEHLAGYVAALKGFYATLSPEQKKTFEEIHAQHAHRHEPMRGKPGARMEKSTKP